MNELRNTLLQRAISLPVQIRADEDEDQPIRISGLGAVFYNENDPGTEYELYPGVVERVMPTAFDELEEDIISTYNHDVNQLLGRTRSGTLRLKVTPQGLTYETEINRDDPTAMGVYAKVKRGDVDGSSIWFYIESETRIEDEANNRVIYEINKVRLKEVGPVAMPAYQATTSEVRSLHADIRRRMEQEAELKIKRDAFIANADLKLRGIV
jgi:HK97 family phage prohead protease